MSRGIVLQRVGGLSPVRQTHKSAPEKYGVWAFVWPYLERFLLGSTGAEGVHPKKGSRYDQLKLEGVRRFVHHGPLYTRIAIPRTEERNGWYLTDADTLATYVAKVVREDSMAMQRAYLRGPHGERGKPKYSKFNPSFQPYSQGSMSMDHWEVFVPRPGEGKFTGAGLKREGRVRKK